MAKNSVARPYFSNNIGELENIFQDSQDNNKILRKLLDELKHRSTPKAAALRTKVEKALEAGGSPTQEQAPVQLPLIPPAPAVEQDEELPSICSGAVDEAPIPAQVEPEKSDAEKEKEILASAWTVIVNKVKRLISK